MTLRKTLLLLIISSLLLVLPVLAQNDEEDELECLAFEDSSTEIRRSYYMGEAFAYVQNGDYSAAIISYRCIIEQIDENYIDAYLNRAVVHTIRRSYDLAIEDYDMAISIDPNFAPVYNNRAIVHTARQEFEEAMADYNQALDIDPSYAFTYNNRGVLHASMGDYESAMADFQQVIELGNLDEALTALKERREAQANNQQFNGEIPEYDVRLTRVYALMGMIDAQRALEDLDDYLLLAGGRADPRLENAAGSLASRFQFDLRFDDTWVLVADFIGDE